MGLFSSLNVSMRRIPMSTAALAPTRMHPCDVRIKVLCFGARFPEAGYTYPIR